jgi:hypothetical protein
MNPEGGDKDTLPPVVTKTQPDSAALNATAKKIILTFNEYITVKDPTKEWTISPAPIRFPEYKTNGKYLEINILDTIIPHTTYAFHFGKSIADINEGNILKDYRFMYSTGGYIDSLEINGTVIDAKTAEPKKEMSVFLKETDTTLLNSKILYRVKTDDLGQFKFQNLANRSYMILGIDDKNNNKQIEKEESITFLSRNILPDSNSLSMYAFVPHLGQQYLKASYSTIPGIYCFVLNIPNYLTPVKISPEDTAVPFKTVLNDTQDTLTIATTHFADQPIRHFNFITTDTQFVQVIKTPTLTDTLLRTKFELKQNSLVVTYNQPIKNISKSLIQLFRDSLQIKIDTSTFQITQQQFHFHHDFEEGIKYHVILPSLSINSVFNKKTAIIDTLQFTKPAPTPSGSLQFNVIDTLHQHTQIELIKEFKTVQRISCNACSTVSFQNIPPDTYQIRILFDRNKNNIFETGFLPKLIEPEHSLILPTLYKVKQDWQQTDLQLIIPSSTILHTPR